MSSIEYIYLLKTEFAVTNNENIYKIGKTHRQNLIRFNEYPRGSILLFQISCKNCDIMERRLLHLCTFKTPIIDAKK